jgi:hypothetical protein
MHVTLGLRPFYIADYSTSLRTPKDLMAPPEG